MISSVGGKNAMPFAGPYAASKFALEGLSELLRRELMLFGIDVIVVAPGAVTTPIWDKGERVDLTPFASTPYAAPLKTMRSYMFSLGRKGLPPERIAETVKTALTSARPKTRYTVAPNAFQQLMVATIAQARHGQAHGPPARARSSVVIGRELFAHQPPPRADGQLPVTISHLELALADWTPRGPPPEIEVDIVREPAADRGPLSRLYDRVGRPWLWYERSATKRSRP